MCQDYFYRLLARREYSSYELKQKGKEKGFEPTEIEAALQELQTREHQSDSRFVESMIRAYQGKLGKLGVRRKCSEKGIPSELFETVWNQYAEDTAEEPEEQFDELKEKILRKYKIENFHHLDPKTKTKIINYLQYRGFNAFEMLKHWQEIDH